MVDACVVDLEVADEFAVDDHVGVGVVDGDGDGLTLVAGADVDLPWFDRDDAAVVDDAGVGVWLAGDGDGVVDDWWCGLPAFDRGDSPDAAVWPFVVVEVFEGVELMLEFVEVGGERLFAEPAFEGLVESFDFAAGLGVVGP